MKRFLQGSVAGAIIATALFAAWAAGTERAADDAAASRAERAAQQRMLRQHGLKTSWKTTGRGSRCTAFCSTRGSRQQQADWNKSERALEPKPAPDGKNGTYWRDL